MGYIFAALGMCIGTGNVWRFPRICASNGGGAFIIAWTIAMLIYAVPLLMSEMVLGKKTRLGTVGAFRDFMGKKNTWMGFFVAAVCLLLMSYYCVVMAYCVKYLGISITSFSASMTTETTTAIWDNFVKSSWQVIALHFVCMAIGCFVVYKGIAAGIEKWCKVLIPTLFFILVGIAIYAVCLPGSSSGLQYLFSINTAYLGKLDTWLNAFVQAAWSTGAGWGFIIVYSVYVREKEDIPNNCIIMGLGDNLGAIIAALAVIPAIFALSPTNDAAMQAVSSGNYGMTFIYLYQLFSTMPGGRIVSAIFFFCLAAAALTSLFSMIEVGVRTLMDCGIKRQRATLYVCGVGFLIGCFSAWSINNLNNQDWVWGLGLMVSGLLISLAIIKYGPEKVRKEEINTEDADYKIPKWYFNTCIRLIPVIVVVMIVWWFVQAIGWYPDSWWSPFEVENVGTVVCQWGIVIIIGLALNKFFNKKVTNGPMTRE